MTSFGAAQSEFPSPTGSFVGSLARARHVTKGRITKHKIFPKEAGCLRITTARTGWDVVEREGEELG